MNATSENDWVDANQRLLVAEFTRLKTRLAGEDEAPAQAEIEAARAGLVDAAEPVAMAHLLHAAHSEASKRERPLSDAETRGWV